MPNVFISYRRQDTAAQAGRLHDRLSGQFGADHVFRDIDDIGPGQDFTHVLQESLGACDALVVLIGKQWLSASDQSGGRRLDNPEDFVRREVAAALSRALPVFPVLVDGATIPREEDLPPDLQPLARRQAIELTDARYQVDTARLIAAIEGGSGFSNRKAVNKMVLITASLLTAVAGAWMYQGRQTARSEPAPLQQPAALRLRGSGVTLTPEQARAAILRFNFFSKSANPAGGIANQLERQVIGDTAVVTDRATGLMWQHGGSERAVTGDSAAETARQANTRKLAGFSDWRVPTLEEAMSLMATKAKTGFHLDPMFDRMAAPFIWTADIESPGRGWVVYYKDGFASPEPLTFNASVRLVRTVEGRPAL